MSATPSGAPQQVVVPPTLEGERVDRVLSLLWALPRSEAAAMVAAGEVRLDGRVVGTRSRRVAAGESLEVSVAAERPDTVAVADAGVGAAIRVVHDDEHVIVVDKPPGLVVHPGAGRATGTLVQGMLARYPEIAGVGDPARPGLVHRLDKGTSGLLVVARTQLAYASLVRQLKARTVSRQYLTLVWGRLEPDAGSIDAPVGRGAGDRTRMVVTTSGREARTHYQVVARFTSPAPLTLLECRLDTGRTHQVRVHLAAIGHPVVGDGRYGGSRSPLPAPRPFLHAVRLAFDHPATGQRLQFEAPPPSDLEAIRELLA